MRQFLTRKLVSSTRSGGASFVKGRLAKPTISGLSHHGLTGMYCCGFHDVLAELEMIGRQHDDRRSVLEPPELIAFADADVAREDGRPARCRIEHDIEKMQPDACNQYRCDRHQRQDFAV